MHEKSTYTMWSSFSMTIDNIAPTLKYFTIETAQGIIIIPISKSLCYAMVV